MPWRHLLAFLYALRVGSASDVASVPDGTTTEDPPSSSDLLLLQFEHSLKNGMALDDSSLGAMMEVSASGEVSLLNDAQRDANDGKELRFAALREQLAGRVNESGPVYDAIASCFRRAALPQTDAAVAVPAMPHHEAVEEKTLTEEDLQNAVIMILAIQQKLGGNASRPLTDFVDCVSSSSGFMKCLTAIGNMLGMGTVVDAINKIRETGCTSFDGCMAVVKNGVTSVVNAVWDWIKSQANALFEKIKNGVSSAIGSIMDWVNTVVDEAANIWYKIYSSVNTVVNGIASFFKSLPAFQKFDLGELCTPQCVGFWGMRPTDCGAFSDLGQMFTDVCRIDTHAKDFGNKIATCFQKKGLFGIPTPFFDLQIDRFCLPEFIVTPLEYLIGAVIWGQSFAKALIDAAKSIFNTIKEFVATKLGLFQLGTAVAEHHAGETSDRRDLSLVDRSDLDLSKANCGPRSDWHVTLSFTAKLAIGIFKDIFGATPSLGLILLIGCKENTAQIPSLLLKLGFTAAVDLVSVYNRGTFGPKKGKKVDDFLSGVALKFTAAFGWVNSWPKMYKGRVSFSSDLGIEGGLALNLKAVKGSAIFPLQLNLATNNKETGDFTSNFLSPTNWCPQADALGFEVGWTAAFSMLEATTPAPGSAAPFPIVPSFEVNAGISFKFCLINCEPFEPKPVTVVPQVCVPDTFSPSETSRLYSSIWDNNAIGTGHARSTLDSLQAWSALTNSVGQWMQLDLGLAYAVAGTVVQGRVDCCDQWVTSYTVQVSSDGSSFTTQGGTYAGATDRTTKVSNLFPASVVARYVRIVVQAWNNHISMRAGALVCQASPACTSTEYNPPELSRSYSSIWDNNAIGHGHARSTLDSPQAWSALTNSVGQWMQLDLGSVVTVTGTIVQGRVDCCSQRVTKYTVQTGVDGSTLTAVPGVFVGTANDMAARVPAKFPAAVNARYVRFIVQEWVNHISMRAGVTVCQACSQTTNDPTEYSRSYSSIWDNDAIGTGHARSTLGSVQAWSALTNSVGQWLQLDLGVVAPVKGTIVQGRNDCDQWVTSYSVQISTDGSTFTSVPGTFTGSTNRATQVSNVFPSVVFGRYVRIVVQAWYSHISMRAGALLCQETAPCTATVVNPGENGRTYSSIWDNNAIGTGHARSTLDSPQAWSALTNSVGQWMQLDLGSVVTVSGTIVQGRVDCCNQYVSKYTVQTSTDGSNFVAVPGTFTGTTGNIAAWVPSSLPQSVRARYVRFVVQEWGNHISMRAGVIVCQ